MKILSFSGQFKKACYSKGVSENVAMWLFPLFMAMSPAASLPIQMTPRKDSGDYLYKRRGAVEQERNYAYVDSVNYLLYFYATDDVIAKAAAEIEAFKQRSRQTTVSLAVAVKDNALKPGDAFFEQCTKSIFVERLTSQVRDSVRMFCAARLSMHLC